ncbi:SpeB arginase/agmatinase/formimionoglutamate hydrolase SpeB [Brevibacillus reuszeri]|uniref:Arginase n=1 Tax=Brevibacillus reuszeri TaxID=54915 RepID=A0A0K9YXX0_9BACL|nr:agmatinase [Brevibacillus reuszeri]KNB73502.1 arginase [Brevibacillus reuszeri]MED1858705.1 agmatinase [Brevibacillus reuszeri]GED69685.1 SpeB arginase/agmatinase/formimionoglutamate hydrolase SpeB [Brevibacillus reuszeri]
MVDKSEKQVLNLPYTGICSFGKYPICTDLDQLDADVAIIGVPYDMGAQWKSGARMGPRGLREGSTLYSFGLDGAYDIERDEMYLGPDWRIVDCGDVDMVHGDLFQSFENTEEAIRKIVEKGAMPIVLGGDHSITIPVGKALDSVGPFHVIQIDAHMDWADHRSGQRFGHGSCIRRLSEMDHVKQIFQFGIRGISSSKKEDIDAAKDYGSVIMSPRQMRKAGLDAVLEQIPAGERYFVTIDIDGLDPSIAPGTGTPSPGGLSYDEVNEMLEGIAKRGQVIGFDLTEVSPPYDTTGITSQVGARIILDFVSFILKERERK